MVIIDDLVYNLYMSYADRLKDIRLKAGLTQKEVEEALELRSLMLKDLETDRVKLSVELAVKLAEFYGMSVDELLGVNQSSPSKSRLQTLLPFFTTTEYQLILSDPIIQAHLSEHGGVLEGESLFEKLTKNFSKRMKLSLALDALRALGSLMGCDGKVTQEELLFLKTLGSSIGLKRNFPGVTQAITDLHYPKQELYQGNMALKHFLVWIMYFMASMDRKVTLEEQQYIEKCAETLRLSRANFLFIKRSFQGK